MREEISRLYHKAETSLTAALFVVEVPLLYETGSENFYDAVIAVIAEETLCKERFRKATGNDDNEFFKRMARQLSPLEKAKRADYVLINNAQPQQLQKQVTDLYEKLTAFSN